MQEITRILIIEDLHSDYELAQREILKVIPNCQFDRVQEQSGFLMALEDFQPDLIVSEYNLQNFGGMKVLSLLRERSAVTPVIILTGTPNAEKVVDCMKAGAADYVLKSNIERLGPATIQALQEGRLLLAHSYAEETIRYLSRLAEENPSPVLRAGLDGKVIYANSASQRLLNEWESSLDGYLPAGWKEIVAEVYQSNRKRFVDVCIDDEIYSIQIVPVRESGHVNLYGHEITEGRNAEHRLRESENRYRALFEDLPIAIFEEDYSEVKKHLDHLKDHGVTDFRSYFDSHPFAIAECAKLIRILDINRAGGQMYGVASEKDLFTSFQKDLTHDEMELLKEVFIAIAEGKTRAYWEGADTNAAGESIVTSVNTSVVPGHEADYSRVIISTTNITERKRAEEELRRQTQTTKALYETTRDLVIERDISKLLHIIVERATQLLSVGGGGLYLCEPEEAQVRCVVSYNAPRDFTDTVLKYGEGAAGLVAQTGEALIIDDYSTWFGRAKAYDDKKYFDAVLSVPIKWQGQVIGVLHALSYGGTRRFYENDMAVLVSFANQAAIAIHNATLHNQLEQQNRIHQALQEATLPLIKELDISEALQMIIVQAAQLLKTSHGFVYLGKPGESEIELRAGTGKFTGYIGRTLKPGEGVGGIVWQTGEALIVRDYHTWTGRSSQFDQDEFRSIIGVPLVSGSRITGVLGLAYLESNQRYSDDDMELLKRFAQLASLALENARLYSLSQQELMERKNAEEGLRESEAKSKALLNALPDMMFRLDREGMFLDCKAEASELYAQAQPTLIGRKNRDVAPPEFADLIDQYVQRALDSREMQVFEYQLPIPERGLRDYEARMVASGDDEVIAVVRDITDRKHAEKELRESQERFHQLANNIQAVFWMTDVETGRKLYISPAGEKIWGRPLDYMLNEADAFIECVLEEDRPYVLNSLEEQRTGKRSDLEYRVVHSDGSIHWIWDRAFPILDENGKKVKILAGIATDVTERKQAEEALRESEERFSSAFEFAPIGMALVSPQGMFLKLNKVLSSMLGYTKQELLTKTFQEITHPDDLETDINHVKQMLAGERISYQMEKRYFHKSGNIVWALLSVSLVKDHEGEPRYFISQIQDITERKRAEQEIQRHVQETGALLETSLALTNLDLKAILQSIGSSAQNLFAADGCRIFLMEPDRQSLRCVLALQEHATAFSDLRIKMGEGVTGAVAASGQAEIVNEMQNDPRGVHVLGTEEDEKEAIMFAPLKERDRTIGVLSIRRAGAQLPFQPTDLELLKAFASMAASAVSNARLFEEAQRRLSELEALYENGLAVGQLLEPRQIGARIIETFTRHLSWHHAAIRLLHPGTDQLEVIALNQQGLSEEEKLEMERHFNEMITKTDQGLSGWVVQAGMPFRTGDVHAHPQYVDTQAGIESGLYMPLKIGERVIGVISVESEMSDAFTEQDERLLATFGNQAAVAFENARLYRTAQEELRERTRTQAALWVSEAHYRELADSITDVLFKLDHELRCTHWNKASEMLTGIPQDEAIGKPLFELFGKSEELIEIGKICEDVLVNRQARIFETKIPLKGQELAFEVSAYPATSGVSVVARDIHERKRMEKALEEERNQLARRVEERTADLSRANSNLARALRVKDEFLANMSHELRTPLNAILGLSESLSEQVAGSINEKQQRYLATINESGHHLLSLINDILDLAKIEAGQITLDISKVNLKSVCEASLRMIKQLAQKKNQEVTFVIDEGLDVMWADERRLKQMIVNLLSNAVKFTPTDGRLGLEVYGDWSGNRVLITVWDKGIGISEPDLDRLFKPFVQLDPRLAREATGTGLGLALVAQMARLHGGSVSVESQLGEGSRFTIQLPWEPALAPDSSIHLRSTGKFKAIDPQATNKPTILLIEDTREVVMMLVDYLEMAGFKMVAAQDGIEGLEKAKLTHPDLILMDIQMPRMNGFETTHTLRMDPEFKGTPIIALTALAMPNDRQRCLEAGMDEYISKPVNLRALVKIIKSILFEKAEIPPK